MRKRGNTRKVPRRLWVFSLLGYDAGSLAMWSERFEKAYHFRLQGL